MAEIGTAYVSLIPSAKGFGAGVEKELGGSGTKAGGTASKGFKGSFLKGAAGIGTAMVGLFAVDKVKDFFTSSIGEARESQKVSAITANVIKTTGGAARVSAKQIGDLTTAISNKTGIDDEAHPVRRQPAAHVQEHPGRGRPSGNDIFDQITHLDHDRHGCRHGQGPQVRGHPARQGLQRPGQGDHRR